MTLLPQGPDRPNIPSTPPTTTTALGSSSGGGDITGYPKLEVDHDRGEWKYLGVVIERPVLTFFGMQEMRRFYAQTYNQNPKAPLTCGSWNSFDAFGYGGRQAVGTPRLRDCETCPRASYESNKHDLEELWCAPTPLMFGMLVHKDSDVWTPFFWDAGGKTAGVAKSAFRRAAQAARAMLKKQPDGSVLETRPVYTFGHLATLARKQDGKKGYLVTLAPTPIPDPDIAFIASYRRQFGDRMWNEEVARRTEKCKTLAGTVESVSNPEGSPSPGGASAPAPVATDYGEVPF